MRTKYLIALLPVFFAIFFSSGFSQNVEKINAIRSKYPDASAIFLNKTQEFRLFIENGSVKGTCTVHDEILINKEAGIKFQNREVASSSFIELAKISGYTLVPNGNKYQKKEIKEFDKKDDTDRNVFFDDQETYSFTYPSAQVGAIMTLDYQLTYKEPRFMGSYFWTSYIPLENEEIKIVVPKAINIHYKLLNVDKITLDFSKEERKNEIVYTWKSKNRQPKTRYGDAPDYRYYEPHLLFYITDYEVEGKKTTLLGTPADLYKWYQDIQKNLNKTEDKVLKKVTDSLINGSTDEWDKVKKIFYWVQDNISYVAFEDGLGGFVPRDAGVVCSRKFGDCKDMASIINEMLAMAGIKSYLTWIGSRDVPYTYTEIPTPFTDNHMIVSYRDKNNNWRFLDGTGKKAPIELYTSFIQGKQALIGIAPDSFLLQTVPVKDTSASQTVDSITLTIKDKILIGNGKVTLTGYDALDYMYRTEHKNKEDALDFFKNYFSKGNNKVSFKDVSVQPALRGPLVITYKFEVPDYVKFTGDEQFLNLNMDKKFMLESIEADRNVPVEMRHITKQKMVTLLTIPENFKVEYLPPNIQKGNHTTGFSSTYSLKGNTLVHNADFYVNTLILQPADFEEYNKIVNEQVKAFKQVVSFIKK
jgi:transglutaminase-like putative cysteine protease